MARPVITLTTDFSEDFFAGVMKGVIAGINPDAHVIDITHALALGDIRAGAFALMVSCAYFPAGSIHVVVVDPGVGSARRILCARTQSYVFLAPDNGILSWMLDRQPPIDVHAVEERKFFLPAVSSTFHGRDVFAPVAAHLSLGTKVEELGPPVAPGAITRIEFPKPVRPDARTLKGKILYIDRFGNGITNISADDLKGADLAAVRVDVLSSSIKGLSRSYVGALPGTALALLGSAGFLEIACSVGSAAKRFGLKVGENVTVVS
jgi:S-adenosylmethionine hydrolase